MSTVGTPDALSRTRPAPGARVTVAVVWSTGELGPRPRTLHVFADGESTAVRRPSGELVWLERPGLRAFPGGPGRVRVVDADGRAPLPEDVGGEASAMTGLSRLCSWVGSPAPDPTDGSTARIRSADGRDLVAEVDPVTGWVLTVSVGQDRPPYALELRDLAVRPWQRDWLQPTNHVRLP